MAMTGTGMASAVQTAILGLDVGNDQVLGDVITDDQKQKILDSWEIIAGAIVLYIQGNAAITITHTHLDPVSGITSGPSNAESIT